MIPTVEIREKYTAWWQGKNKGPLLYITAPRSGSAFDALDRPRRGWERSCRNSRLADAMDYIEREGDWDKLEQTLAVWDEAQACTFYAGVGYPLVRVNTGPGAMASYISGRARFASTGDGTVWFQVDQPTSWETIMAFQPESRAHWWELSERCMARIAGWAAERVFVAQPGLGGPLDVLASLRTANQLLYDCLDSSEQVKAAQRQLEGFWEYYLRRTGELLASSNGPNSASWLQVWAPGTSAALECDFSAMISPRMFEELVLPSLARQCSLVDYPVYHVDGQNALQHLGCLLSLDKLRAIQWAPIGGTSVVHAEEWYPLYKRIVDAGKRVILLGFNPGALDALFARLPREAFFLTIHCSSEEEAQALAQRYDG